LTKLVEYASLVVDKESVLKGLKMNYLESLFDEVVHDVMVSDKFSKSVVAEYIKNQEQGWGGIYTLTIDGVAHRGVYAEKMESFADVLDRIQHELDMENLHIPGCSAYSKEAQRAL